MLCPRTCKSVFLSIICYNLPDQEASVTNTPKTEQNNNTDD